MDDQTEMDDQNDMDPAYFYMLLEKKEARMLKQKSDTSESQKALVKLQSHKRQIMKEGTQIHEDLVAGNRKLSMLRVNLDHEKDRNVFLEELYRKQTSENESLKKELEEAKSSLETIRSQGAIEIMNECDGMSLAVQAKAQKRLEQVDLEVIEKLKIEKDKLEEELQHAESVCAENEKVASESKDLQTKLVNLEKDINIQKKCIKAWKIKIEKCKAKSRKVDNVQQNNHASVSGNKTCNLNNGVPNTAPKKRSYNQKLIAPPGNQEASYANQPSKHQRTFDQALIDNRDIQMMEQNIESEVSEQEQMMMQYFNQ